MPEANPTLDSASPAPINALPPEILIHVFHLVLARPCNLHQIFLDKTNYSRYPDHLAQVCALWRKIAISSCDLWSHIDISPYESDGLVTRAQNHVARAGDLPIELHIATGKTWVLKYDALYQLLSLIMTRVENFELSMAGAFGGFHCDVLKLLFNQSSALTKLDISTHHYYSNNFIVPNSPTPTDLEGNFWLLTLPSTESEVENSLAPIRVLHLRGIFPLWSSKAYHDLVDLRLLSTKQRSQIKETEFVTILRSSPGLRILHFGLEICNPTPQIEEAIPAHLRELEVVKIFTSRGECPGNVLRLLSPGSKPLKLSLEDYYIPTTSLVTHLEEFFTRSTVTKFYSLGFFPPTSVFRQAINLEQLILDRFQSFPGFITAETWLGVGGLAALPRLRSFHIMRSVLLEFELRYLVQYCPDGTVLNSCCICDDGSDELPVPKSLTAPELSAAFPTVRIVDHILYPLEYPMVDWDLLD